MNQGIQNLIDRAINSIFYVETADANRIIKELKQFLAENRIQQSDPALWNRLQRLLIRLKIIALSHLTDQEAADILQNHYLESFNIEAPMEDILAGRLFSVPDGARDDIREPMKRALMQNTEKLGEMTIGQWISEFEKKYNVNTRSLSASLDFVNSHPAAMRLDGQTKDKLKKILHAYDYLLVTSIPVTEPELSQIINSLGEGGEISMSEASKFFRPEDNETPTSSSQNILLDEALKTYPQIAEQIITSMPIKIQSFPQPARPSIKNWLSDYTYNLGYGSHNSIVRNNYLFQNSNAKVLGVSERERLSYILKAYDEKSLVTVDTARKQIVFPAATPNSASHQTIPPSQPARIDMNTQPHVENNSSSRVENRLSEISNQTPLSRSTGAQNNVYNDVSKNIQKNYDFYQMPPKAPAKDGGQTTSFGSHTNQNFSTPANRQSFGSDTANHLGSPAFKPEVHPVSPVNNLTFSSTQKLPFEREKEENPYFSTPAPNPVPPKIPSQPAPPKPIEQEKPYEPQPLRINPATYDDEEQDELPRNVVNLRDQ